MKNTFWENKIYSQGRSFNKYPYDSVVSFIFKNYPSDKERADVKILEVGCGAGNNLWFAAKEGFQVTGIDGSRSAIDFAVNRFKIEELQGVFHNGDFTKLPFDENQFDLVVDRAAITCCGWDDVEIVISEIYRVTRPSGRFMFNVYSDAHCSFKSGEFHPNGAKVNMTEGALKGIENIYFFNREEINALFPPSKWNMISCQHHKTSERIRSDEPSNAEWTVIIEKI